MGGALYLKRSETNRMKEKKKRKKQGRAIIPFFPVCGRSTHTNKPS